MSFWTIVLDILILLFAAMVLGGICVRLRQNPIIGYLLAGMFLGPNALDLLPNYEAITAIAELGVALLLFVIGLEFSWRRLRSIGVIALGGGTLQVLVTAVLSAGVCRLLGFDLRLALTVGAIVALSSTAVVLRLLINRVEIDSIHGRNALGILLFQDIAVVPLVLLVTALGGGGSIGQIVWDMGRAVVVAALLVGTLYILLNYIVPLLLRTKEAARSRELPVLLAMVTAVGTGWVSHELGLSPVLGAFVAGMLLAESPFATQIRADVTPLRILFVTLFFSSIGAMSNPAWILEHWVLIVAVVAAIMIGKAIVVTAVTLLFSTSLNHAVATGICLAQIGEFSFVLTEVAKEGQLISGDLFELIIAATIVTLFLTPYLIAVAPHAATAVGRLLPQRSSKLPRRAETSVLSGDKLRDHILIVGFGPAGKHAAEELMKGQKSIIVVELNPKTAADTHKYGFQTYIGDATRTEVLEHLQLEKAMAVVITVPDPSTVRQIIGQVHALSPDTIIVARARYHMYSSDFLRAGAHAVVDEEEEVGLLIAAEVQKRIVDY
ncbi:sodium:proton exchanger [candidate division LCP-89 bacterium B3_LCP]|uniref:Sodium:proton exchanger n=1 Tax=candidate division LCP-89 bacterium B3_LCP TaxID=2012998 RepID=A0A532V503_UNCL8|nr:MAG: sodium:proton exchanger [candidate division LCP-89 bacterium B3_LCP]